MIHIALAAYNEEKGIGDLLSEIYGTIAEHGLQARLVVTDDGSKDGTAEIVEGWRGKLPIDLIRQDNAGFTKALERSLRHVLETASDDDVCVTMDADHTHSPALVPTLAREILAGHDVVIASRFQKGAKTVGVPFYRQVLSGGARFLMRLFVPLEGVRDYSTAFRAYRVAVLREGFRLYPDSLLQGKGFAGMAGFLIRLSFVTKSFREVPFVLRYDLKKGSSKLRTFQTIEGYLGIIASFLGGHFRPK